MQPWINQHPFVFVFILLAGTVVFRWVLLNLIAGASGWKMLAARFVSQQAFSGREWKWQSARMRFQISYNNCLRVGADQMGLFMHPMWGARTAHPPLFIPWNQISAGQASGWMASKYMKLSLGRSEQIPFTIRNSLGENLKLAAGSGWTATPQSQIKIADGSDLRLK